MFVLSYFAVNKQNLNNNKLNIYYNNHNFYGISSKTIKNQNLLC